MEGFYNMNPSIILRKEVNLMQIYQIIPIFVAVLVLIYFIPDDMYDRYEYFIKIVQGASILVIISSILLIILSLI